VGAATGTSPGALSTGADVTTTDAAADIYVAGGTYIYGCEFYSEDDIYIATSGNHQDLTLETCRLELVGTSSADLIYIGRIADNDACRIIFIDVDVDFAQASQHIRPRYCHFQWRGGVVGFDVDSLLIPDTDWSAALVEITGVDFSVGASSALVSVANNAQWNRYILSRCLLGTSANVITGTNNDPGSRVESYHCQIGTDSDPAYQMEIHDYGGKIITDTSRYRTGGAKDSERTNPISWDMNTSVHSIRGYPGHALVSPPISAWTDGDASTSHTYRIAFASDATIQDDELWMELEGPNDAATNSMAVFNTDRVAPLTSAANHTTDSGSSWTGSGVGTKQYMEVTYTPDKPGPVTVRVYMAKASDNVYIDPLIQIDP
jgi:hypothetical protein